MRRRISSALTTSAVIFIPFYAAAQGAGERSDYWHRNWEWGWGHMAIGSLMMVLFWGLIIVLIVLAVRWLSGGRSGMPAGPSSNETPLDILERRFARGEIDKEEFEEKKKMLSG